MTSQRMRTKEMKVSLIGPTYNWLFLSLFLFLVVRHTH